MRKTVKRVKTGGFERRLSMARAGLLAGARYATLTAGTFFGSRSTRQERRRVILSEQARWLVDELGQLKGSVVKIGQMLALFGEHFLPEEVTEALHSLENNTTALRWSTIEAHLREQLGDERMARLDIEQQPLGAASLAQVHRATCRDTGRELVLKIQYPGVADAIDSDMRALVQLLRVSRLVPITEQFNEWLDEVREMLKREVDYHLEARTTRWFRDELAGDDRYIVPEIVDEFCTDVVLCMTFEHGVHITDPAVAELSQPRRNFLGRAIMELCLREVFDWERMQTDPNFGNYLLRVHPGSGQDQIVLLDFGAIREFHRDIIGPGREMIRGAWHHDRDRLVSGLRALDFLSGSAPDRVRHAFAELCFEAVEVLQDPDRFPPPPHVINKNGEYLWGASDLPKRVLARASRNALSVYFDVPPKEFIFLARKLLGAYTFLHVIEAEVRGNLLLEPFLPMHEDDDRQLVQEMLQARQDQP